MGCAPSSQVGVRRALGDPFHTAVAPMSPHINGWTSSQFAGVPFPPPLPECIHDDDPPPYSEVAVNGQVTLERGCSPVKRELEVVHEHTLEPWRNIGAPPPTAIQRPNSSMEIEEEEVRHVSMSTSFSCSEDHNYTSLHEESAHPTEGYFPQRPESYNPAAVFPSYPRSVSVDALPPDPQRRSSSSSVHSESFFPPRQVATLPLQPSHPSHPPSLAPLQPSHPSHPPPLAPLRHFQETRIYPIPPTFPSHPLTPPQLHYNGSLHPHMRLPPLQHQTKRHRKRRRGHTWHGEVPAIHMQDTTPQCS